LELISDGKRALVHTMRHLQAVGGVNAHFRTMAISGLKYMNSWRAVWSMADQSIRINGLRTLIRSSPLAEINLDSVVFSFRSIHAVLVRLLYVVE
jgi:hypothetical protein